MKVFERSKRPECIAGIATAIFLFGVTPVDAHSSSGWDSIKMEIKALPPGYQQKPAMTQSALDQIRLNVIPALNASAAWTFVTEGEDPTIQQWVRRSDGSIDEVTYQGTNVYPSVHDPLNLFPWTSYSVASVSLSAALSSKAPMTSVSLKTHAFGVNDTYPGYWVNVEDQDCQLSGSAMTGVSQHCISNTHTVFGDYEREFDPADEKPRITTSDRTYVFIPTLGIFTEENSWKDVVDWRADGHPWHSQTVSAGLSAAQREQARALFARGFDFYKTGDFTGALALEKGGRAIDPGNYLGWFTMAEICRSQRSQLTQGERSDELDEAMRAYYQHTIDLAPDSPEAILAKGYLSK